MDRIRNILRLASAVRHGKGSLLLGAGLMTAVLFAPGCAAFKGGQNDSSTPSCPPAADCPSRVSVSGSGPAPDGSVVAKNEDASAQNVSKSTPSSTSGAASGAASTPTPSAAPSTPPPAAAPSGSSVPTESDSNEIMKNPNASTEAGNSENISPTGYEGRESPSFDKKDIPNGYQGLTQTPPSTPFQNASQETGPQSPNSGGREIPAGNVSAERPTSTNRVQYRTIIEE